MAAVAAPIAMGVFDGDEDEDDAITESEEDVSDGGSLLTAEGTNHVIDGTTPSTTIEGFEPGKDRATLQFPDWDANLEVRNDAEGSVQIDYSGADGPVNVVFKGLGEIPAADIDIAVTDPETNEQTIVCLMDCLTDPSLLDGAPQGGDGAANVPEPTQEALQPIAPSDPDAPDAPGVALPGVAPIGPVDPDAPDAPGVALPEDLTPLDPLLPDTPEDLLVLPDAIVSDLQDGQLPGAPVFEEAVFEEAAAPLGVSDQGGAETPQDAPEMPLSPQTDSADGGAEPLLDPLGPAETPLLPGLGQTQLVLRGPDDVLIAADVADFDAREDILQISVDMEPGATPPTILVSPMADGSGSQVFLDGAAMALLHGAPDAGPENIRVVPFGA